MPFAEKCKQSVQYSACQFLNEAVAAPF